jgi:hypothetical protein
VASQIEDMDHALPHRAAGESLRDGLDPAELSLSAVLCFNCLAELVGIYFHVSGHTKGATRARSI